MKTCRTNRFLPTVRTSSIHNFGVVLSAEGIFARIITPHEGKMDICERNIHVNAKLWH